MTTPDAEIQSVSANVTNPARQPLNQILYGPPGTGKTYATVDVALEILAPEFLNVHRDNRAMLKKRFDDLVRDKSVRFVTFHQSFSYEDFVEGLRAVSDDDDDSDGTLKYKVEPGVFKRICEDARTEGVEPGTGIRSNPRIWKISIKGTGPSKTLTYCLTHGEARIGWGETGDLTTSLKDNQYYNKLSASDHGTLRYFSTEMVPGDILLCIHSSETINAIGVVKGPYRFDPHPPNEVVADYNHVRPVEWLYRDLNLSILPLNDGKQFVQKTVYAMKRLSWGDLITYLTSSGALPIKEGLEPKKSKPHVLVIDEINRGNVSRIFGELITLIEPSKREGAPEALIVELPYSKKPFSVPDNIYLVGTMNTADRSLAGLDIALRRRFVFREMLPQPSLLDGIVVDGLDIAELLRVMNQRIEALLDRNHCLGHAYFLPLRNNAQLAHLEAIFRRQILPLLQEYFFDDWQRIQWVLNDQRKKTEYCFVYQSKQEMQTLFGDNVDLPASDLPWVLNEEAFDQIEAYIGIIDHNMSVATLSVVREANHPPFTIRQLPSGTIQVLRDGTPLVPALPELRRIADQLGVPHTFPHRTVPNTRELGRKVIDAIKGTSTVP